MKRDSESECVERQPPLGAELYELFDAKRMRIMRRDANRVFTEWMTADEVLRSNAHFARSLCPHLYWQPDGTVKTYKIRR